MNLSKNQACQREKNPIQASLLYLSLDMLDRSLGLSEAVLEHCLISVCKLEKVLVIQVFDLLLLPLGSCFSKVLENKPFSISFWYLKGGK